jgi:hypothetical protein
MPRQLLDITWAHAKVILSRAGPGPLKSVAPEHWPIVFGIVAQHLVRRAKDVLNPRISLILLMESAIAMSKVDPATVPQVPPVSKEQKS